MATARLPALVTPDSGTCDTNLWVALAAAVLLDLVLLYWFVLVPCWQGSRWEGSLWKKERPRTRAPKSTMLKVHSVNVATVDSAAATWHLSMVASIENSEPNSTIQDRHCASLPTSTANPTPRSSKPRRSSKPSVLSSSEVRALDALCREDRRSGGPFKAGIAPYTTLGARQALSLGASSSSVIMPLVPALSQRLPPCVVRSQSVASQRLAPPRFNTAAPIQDQRLVPLSKSMAKLTPRSSDPWRSSEPKVPTFKEIRAALEALCREDHLPGSRDDVAREVDVTLCHNLRAAGFSVSAEVARTLPAGQQQVRGHVVHVTSDHARGSASYLLDAPTCLSSSPTSTPKGPPPRAPKKVQKGPPPKRCNPTSCRKAPTNLRLGLDSREKDHWSGMTTHPEEYYVRDLHGMSSPRMLRIANRFIGFHAMQAQLDKLSAYSKVIGEVPTTRPDRFKLLPRSQKCQLPRCFVQESQVQDRVVPTLLPTEEIERSFFKTLAENIKTRHAAGLPTCATP